MLEWETVVGPSVVSHRGKTDDRRQILTREDRFEDSF